MPEEFKVFIDLLSKHCKINRASFTSNEIYTIWSAVEEYKKLNGETLESKKSVCAECGGPMCSDFAHLKLCSNCYNNP